MSFGILKELMLGGSSYNKKYTLNFDGSHNNQSPKSGAGCVIRDNEGDMVLAASYNLDDDDHCDVAIAEAIALRNGLRLAKINNIKVDFIKGDNKEVVDHVQGIGARLRAPKVALSKIIAEIKGSLYQLNLDPLSQIQLIGRDSNKVADKLASLGSCLPQGATKIYKAGDLDLPYAVAELIRQEKSSGSRKKEDEEVDWSSTVDNIGKVGAAVVGVATIAWGISKLFSGDLGEEKPIIKGTSQTWNPKFPKYLGGFCILNFDGSDINQFQKAGAGCIIRDKQGNFVIAASYNLDDCYPDCHVAIAEATALRNGLNLAKANNVKLDLIQGDNKEVIDRVLGRERKPPRVPFLGTIIGEIRNALYEQLIDPESQIKLIHGGQANRVADKLASLGSLSRNVIYTRYEDLPFEVACLVEQDKFLGNFK